MRRLLGNTTGYLYVAAMMHPENRLTGIADLMGAELAGTTRSCTYLTTHAYSIENSSLASIAHVIDRYPMSRCLSGLASLRDAGLAIHRAVEDIDCKVTTLPVPGRSGDFANGYGTTERMWIL